MGACCSSDMTDAEKTAMSQKAADEKKRMEVAKEALPKGEVKTNTPGTRATLDDMDDLMAQAKKPSTVTASAVPSQPKAAAAAAETVAEADLVAGQVAASIVDSALADAEDSDHAAIATAVVQAAVDSAMADAQASELAASVVSSALATMGEASSAAPATAPAEVQVTIAQEEEPSLLSRIGTWFSQSFGFSSSTAIVEVDALSAAGGDGGAATASLSASQVSAAKQAFNLMDVNGDGVLTRIEVIKACRTNRDVRAMLGLPEQIRQEDGTRDQFEAVFQAMDADASKGVDESEFLQAVAKMSGTFGGGSASSGGALEMTSGLESTRAIQEQMHKVRTERMLPAPATTAPPPAAKAAAPLIDVNPSATLPKVQKIYAPIKYP